jgi:APA family basic amino acid/polyamine antiporter
VASNSFIDTSPPTSGLSRELGLLGLAATGICSMLGAAINIIPFAMQRNVPGIGPHVLSAYVFAWIPAMLAALAYAILASAMPRAGGSYIYASRAINPYLGFVASFSQWFGLSIAIGVVSYVIVPFLRDMAAAAGWGAVAATLDEGLVRVSIALLFLWTFVAVNIRGLKLYERTLIPLMFLMFILGSVVIVAGFAFTKEDFIAAVPAAAEVVGGVALPEFDFGLFLAASAILFSSFIGFDSIAQAGGEARNPGRSMPIAIAIAVVTVGAFYMLFTAAVYNTVPWQYVASEAMQRDVTAPGLLGAVLPAVWTIAIVGGAAVALINDLPAMILAVSRLMFAWAEDGIFPKTVAALHPRRHTPHVAIVLSGLMATAGILGSHVAGDFFLGVDLLVISMLVNFMLMCVSVLVLPRRNPHLAREVRAFPSRTLQVVIAVPGIIMLGGFLVVHIWKDLAAPVAAWYFHSTYVWVGVMAIASIMYVREMRKLKTSGVDIEARFKQLPPG